MNQKEEFAATCVNCRFHDQKILDNCIICRRHAPTRNDHSESDHSWPRVSDNDWCGEFEPYHNRPPKPPWE